MCRNGHTEKETLRTAPGEAYSAGPRPARLAHLNRDGVTRLQHRWKISSILIRNTVVPIATPTTLGSCLVIEGVKSPKTRSFYEHHPPGRSKTVRTAVGRSIFPADEIGRAQKHRLETNRSQLAAHRKAKEKPAGVNRRAF
jgi:hypothetical protein